MENQQVVEYASMNRRLIAACIDTLIIFVIFSPVLNYLDSLIYHGRPPYVIIQELVAGYEPSTSIDASELFKRFSTEKIWQKMFILNGITLVILATYSLTFWYKLGATPGKLLLSCKIVDKNTLQKPSLLKLFMRLFGYFISFILLGGIGFIIISLTEKKQSLHDKMAGTLVIIVKQNFNWLQKIGISKLSKTEK